MASNGATGTAFVAFDGHRSDDFAPYVYRSDDFGQSWRPIVDGLPRTSVNALEQHPENPNLLFLGNEVGAYVSIDAGGQWVNLDGGLPTVPVDDIVVHPRDNDLVLGTHGRGIWIMDDIGPLEELSSEILDRPAHLFTPRSAVSYNMYRPQGWTPGIYAADNPEPGARLRYHLAEAGDSTRLEVRDGQGTLLRELWGPADSGLNEVIWDLRLVEEDANGTAMDPGPRVLPGAYVVNLTAGEEVLEAQVEVRLDPRVQIAPGDLAARQTAMLDAYRLSGSVEKAEDAIEAMVTRGEEIRALLDDAEDPPPVPP